MSSSPHFEITATEEQYLLKLARGSITYYLEHGKVPTFDDFPPPDSKVLTEKCGAFVTLTKEGQLRGCIGQIPPVEPLIAVVAGRAIDSALNDPRFASVTLPELDDLHIEISILTPPTKVDSYEDIVVGQHGMVLSKNGRSSVFLPQVAPEQGWDLATTLTHLSMKAGLLPDDWREGASFEVFEAIIIHEKKD